MEPPQALHIGFVRLSDRRHSLLIVSYGGLHTRTKAGDINPGDLISKTLQAGLRLAVCLNALFSHRASSPMHRAALALVAGQVRRYASEGEFLDINRKTWVNLAAAYRTESRTMVRPLDFALQFAIAICPYASHYKTNPIS